MKGNDSEKKTWTLILLESSWTLGLLEDRTQGLTRRSLLVRYLGHTGTNMAASLGTSSASAGQVAGVIEDRPSYGLQESLVYWDESELWAQLRHRNSGSESRFLGTNLEFGTEKVGLTQGKTMF